VGSVYVRGSLRPFDLPSRAWFPPAQTSSAVFSVLTRASTLFFLSPALVVILTPSFLARLSWGKWFFSPLLGILSMRHLTFPTRLEFCMPFHVLQPVPPLFRYTRRRPIGSCVLVNPLQTGRTEKKTRNRVFLFKEKHFFFL